MSEVVLDCSTWTCDDGWPLRVGTTVPAGARGTLLFLNGRADFLEKYSHAHAIFRDWGLAVASLDWRGQGGSGRLADDRHKGHQDDFGRWLHDVSGWLMTLRATLPEPWYVVAHSMGGNIALQLLHAQPAWFRAAVLMAPLLGLSTRPVPQAVMRRLAAWQVRHGRGSVYAPGQTGYGPAQHSTVRFNLLTSDRALFDEERAELARQPELALGGVTYGWLDACYRSLEAIAAPGWPEAVATPALMLLPELEALVLPEAARAIALRMPHCLCETVPGARHELLREAPAIRTAVFARIREFLLPAEERLA